MKEIQGASSGRLVYDRSGNVKKYCSGSSVSGNDTDCTGTDVLALAWNGLNQLIQATRARSTETYAYDDSGRRIGKTAGASTTRYQYDGPDILAEYGGASAEPIALYAHGAGMDEPLMRLTGEAESPQAQVAYYVQGGVGSVVATFGEPEPSVNLAREPGVVITQGSGGSYTVSGVASNPATLNNGETRASGGHWTVTSGRTLDIVLAGSRSVSEVVLVGNPGTTDDPLPNEGGTWPADSQFDTSRYTVQTWSGSAWQTVGSASGNTLHIRRVSFAPVTTDRIRVIPTDDASNGQTPNDNLVSLTEIEVRSPAGAGEIRAQRFDAWGQLEQAAGSVPTYGYTGREPDATGLIHYRARYYHPELARFVSRDPLGLSAGINPYAYADGNPVLFNDPDGLMAALAWNSASSYVSQNGTRLLDGTQTVLDVAGLVPGFGELADGANALIYLGRGDNTNAALSGAAMIPFIGWGATTAKVVGRVDNAADAARGAGEASSLVNAARLRMQLKAEEVAGARLPSEITGYSRHGLNQAISRDGLGVATGAILDAVKNPLSVTGQSGGRFMMTGKDAVVIVNAQGKVITTWATNAAGVR